MTAPPAAAPTVAVLGLGAMGLPIATRLAGRFRVTGFDPAADRRHLAERAGIPTAGSPADAASAAARAVVATRDLAQTEETLFGPRGAAGALPRGAAVVLTSTIGPAGARDLADRLDRAGLVPVDAPVSGGPARAGSGDLLIAVGAPPEAAELARAVLDRLASTLVVVGARAGDGQLLKTVNQLLAGVHIAAAAEALALARAVGLDPHLVIAALSKGAGASFMLSDRGPRMLQAFTGEAEVRSRVDIFVKDLRIVNETAERAGVPTRLAAAAEQLYRAAAEAGLAASDDSAVVRLLAPDAGPTADPRPDTPQQDAPQPDDDPPEA